MLSNTRRLIFVSLVTVSAVNIALVFFPWVSSPEEFSLSGLESARLDLPFGLEDGHLAIGLACVALSAAAALTISSRLDVIAIGAMIATGLVVTAVGGYLASSEWRTSAGGDILFVLDGKPTAALYGLVACGFLYSLIGGLAAMVYLDHSRRDRHLVSENEGPTLVHHT
jgi:hypothetical protein